MKKCYCLFKMLIMAVLLASCDSVGDKKETDVEKDGFKGCVKCVREYDAVVSLGGIKRDRLKKMSMYDERGNKTETCHYKDGRIISDRSTMLYDEKGNEIEWCFYKEDKLKVKKISEINKLGRVVNESFFVDGSLAFSNTYQWDKRGFLLSKYDGKEKEKIKYKNDLSGKKNEESCFSGKDLKYKVTYKYDRDGNQIEYCRYNAGGDIEEKAISKFNNRGNELEVVVYKKDSSTERRASKYDKSGNRIEFCKYKVGFKESLIEKVTNKYNKDGKVIEECLYASNGLLSQKKEFKYDDKGSEVEYCLNQGDSTIMSKIIYVNDKNGNHIEEWCYWRESDLVGGTIREFEYYADIDSHVEIGNYQIEKNDIIEVVKTQNGGEIIFYKMNGNLYVRSSKNKTDTKIDGYQVFLSREGLTIAPSKDMEYGSIIECLVSKEEKKILFCVEYGSGFGLGTFCSSIMVDLEKSKVIYDRLSRLSKKGEKIINGVKCKVFVNYNKFVLKNSCSNADDVAWDYQCLDENLDEYSYVDPFVFKYKNSYGNIYIVGSVAKNGELEGYLSIDGRRFELGGGLDDECVSISGGLGHEIDRGIEENLCQYSFNFKTGTLDTNIGSITLKEY